MTPNILPPVMGKIAGQAVFFSFRMATDIGGGKF